MNKIKFAIMLISLFGLGVSYLNAGDEADAQKDKKVETKTEKKDSWWSFFSSEDKKKAPKIEGDDDDDDNTNRPGIALSEDEEEERKQKEEALKKRKIKVQSNIDKYKSEQKDIHNKMHSLRIKLIKKNPDLQKIRAKIMNLYRELALKIDRNADMRELIDANERIDLQLLILDKERNKLDKEHEKLKSK